MSVRTRLTVLGAGAVLGSATVLGLGAAPALACTGGEPLAAPPTAPSAPPSPSGSAAPSEPVPTADPAAGAVLRLLPPTPGTLVAGGPPVGFTAEIANTGTTAFTGVVPLAAVRGDGARAPQRALRAEEVLFQVRTPAGWEPVPLAADCDGALRGGPAGPTADLAPGGTARYAFRLSVSAPGPGAGELDVRLGVRSAAGDGFRDASHLVLPLAPAAGPGAPSATATLAAAGPGDTVPGSAPVPHTEALGVAAGPDADGTDASPVPGGSPVPTVTLSPAGAAARLSTPAEAGRPPLSLLISGVALITLGAVGLTLVLTNRR